MNFIEHLAVEIEQTGHKVTWAGTGFSIEPIGLKVDAGVGERVVHDGFDGITVVFTIRIKATHDIMFPEGIWDELAGFGVDDDEAFSYASMIWASGTFPPIHEILVPTATEGFPVKRLDLVSRNDETGELLAWHLYLGPLQANVPAETREWPEDILMKRLFTRITSVLSAPELLWIKLFISKLPDNLKQGTCWLNNMEWPEALSDLYDFADEWGTVETPVLVKQFMIVKPTEWNENSEKLTRSLPREPKSGFFGRLFGK